MISLQPDSKAWLGAIIDSSDDAIVSKTLDGIVTTWNTSAERMFGYTAAEMVGKPIRILIPPDRQQEEDQILERLRRGERVDHFQSVRLRKDGRVVHVSLTISPVKNSSGTIVGASKIARDITEQIRLDCELREAKETAEAASNAKDQFLSVLGHELRTPLNAIVGWSQLLRASNLPEAEIRQAVETIERNARMQAKIIEDLLDMSRIATGKLRLEVQPVDLLRVIQEAIETVQPSAENKGVRLERVLDSQVGPVRGDAARLQQVVINLLANAIKFTPKGGKVQVAFERVNSHVEITISDTGIGIASEFLPFLFQKFLQADASTTRRHGGLGLGLSIVKTLVELHGGTVQAASRGEGQGATFTVKLPLMVTKVEDQGSGPRAHPTASSGTQICDPPILTGVRVLIVDDEADTRELVKRVLMQCEAVVLTAASAVEALSVIGSERVDVILSDIGMPDVDGFDLIRQIRATGSRVPAAALTAFARPEDRRRALLTGYQTHVAKPVEPIELVAVVASLAGKVGLPEVRSEGKRE